MRGRRQNDPASGELVIDISAAINQRAGIGRYARELTGRLIPLLDPERSRLWYAEDQTAYDVALLGRVPWSHLSARKAPISRLNVDRLIFRESLPFLRFLRIGRPADVYSPDFTAPAPDSARAHVTIHDLAWLHPEAQTPPPLADFLAPVVQRSVQTAATVFTVSNAVRTELLDRYALRDERVIVAPNAAASHFFDAAPLSDEALLALGLRHPFVLFVGTIEPRKNLTALLQAMTRSSPEIQLAVAGRPGWDSRAILSQIDGLHLAGRVVRFGFLPDDLLPRLMASADAVINPSSYEGFGLPIIEALATGSPVVVSDLPVFREVAGRTGIYVQPEEPESFAAAIDQVAAHGDDPLARRQRVERARAFDWRTSAGIVARRLQDVA